MAAPPAQRPWEQLINAAGPHRLHIPDTKEHRDMVQAHAGACSVQGGPAALYVAGAAGAGCVADLAL